MSANLTGAGEPLPASTLREQPAHTVNRSRKPFNADEFLVRISPYVMGVLLLCCMGSVLLAALTATPPVFAHSNMKPGDNHMMNTATEVLNWVSQSTDSLAVVTRTVLAVLAGR
jgi:hypothetical protein